MVRVAWLPKKKQITVKDKDGTERTEEVIHAPERSLVELDTLKKLPEKRGIYLLLEYYEKLFFKE